MSPLGFSFRGGPLPPAVPHTPMRTPRPSLRSRASRGSTLSRPASRISNSIWSTATELGLSAAGIFDEQPNTSGWLTARTIDSACMSARSPRSTAFPSTANAPYAPYAPSASQIAHAVSSQSVGSAAEAVSAPLADCESGGLVTSFTGSAVPASARSSAIRSGFRSYGGAHTARSELGSKSAVAVPSTRAGLASAHSARSMASTRHSSTQRSLVKGVLSPIGAEMPPLTRESYVAAQAAYQLEMEATRAAKMQAMLSRVPKPSLLRRSPAVAATRGFHFPIYTGGSISPRGLFSVSSPCIHRRLIEASPSTLLRTSHSPYLPSLPGKPETRYAH